MNNRRFIFDSLKFINDHRIPFLTKGKNCSFGWININCPFCNDASFHLGFNLNTGVANCWKCGKKYLPKLISILINISNEQAKKIIKKYYINRNNIHEGKYSSEKFPFTITKKTNFPCNTQTLGKKHKKYLDKRNFDPDKLEKEFNLYGTGPYGNFKFRIIAPITLGNRLISYQGRDITERAHLRYMACKKEEEVVHYKNTLYNIDNCTENKCIVVEGITDVWKIGDGSCATFGIGYTKKQVILLAKRFKQIFILFDKDDPAIEKANRLAYELSGIGTEVEIISINEKDPASLKELDAKYLRRNLLGY